MAAGWRYNVTSLPFHVTVVFNFFLWFLSRVINIFTFFSHTKKKPCMFVKSVVGGWWIRLNDFVTLNIWIIIKPYWKLCSLKCFFGGVFWTRFYSFPLPHSDVLLIFHMIRSQKSDSYNTNILVITPSKCPIILNHKGFSVCSFAWGANSMWSTPFLSCFFFKYQ